MNYFKNMNYFKRIWNETAVGKYPHWGNSTRYFETEEDGTVKRQLNEYSIGIRLKYTCEKPHDNYGMLSDVALDLTDTEFKSISIADFNKKWMERNPLLCQTIGDDKITLQELAKIEVDLPLSDRFYDEIWSTGLIDELQHLPMKYGPIQRYEEAMILNEGLDSMIEIFELNKLKFPSSGFEEFDSVLKFIKESKANGRALQFWL
ncbi:MAG: hypothetical protein GY927_12645 [bacterium]|nr:hypothetical protein [bacterium]